MSTRALGCSRDRLRPSRFSEDREASFLGLCAGRGRGQLIGSRRECVSGNLACEGEAVGAGVAGSLDRAAPGDQCIPGCLGPELRLGAGAAALAPALAVGSADAQ
jgi:hypothetical protein